MGSSRVKKILYVRDSDWDKIIINLLFIVLEKCTIYNVSLSYLVNTGKI